MTRHPYMADSHAEQVRRIGDRCDAAVCLIGVVALCVTAAILSAGF